jgi:type II protein arginine methyltransferase
VLWFDAQLTDSIAITNRPERSSHWMQAFQCFPRPVAVEPGQRLRLHARHDDHAQWFWLD